MASPNKAKQVCSNDSTLGGELISDIDPAALVKLKVGSTLECYEFTEIYRLQREAIVEAKPFISPYNRAVFTKAHEAEIDAARKRYVGKNAAKARLFPSLLNVVEGETTMQDAMDALEVIEKGEAPQKAEARARLERILAKGVVTPETTDSDDKTLLYGAIGTNDIELIRRFITPKGYKTKGYGYTPFLSAVDNGNIEVVKLLAPEPTNKAAINATTADGNNALMMASQIWGRRQAGSAEIVKYLLDRYHYDPNQENRDGNLPLIAALSNNNGPVARLLVESGADVNKLTTDMSSPLREAASTGDPETVKYLLSKGAKMYSSSKTNTAYDVALEKLDWRRRIVMNRNYPPTKKYEEVVELLRTVPATDVEAINRPAEIVAAAPSGAVRKARIEQLLRDGVAEAAAIAYANAVNAARARGNNSLPNPPVGDPARRRAYLQSKTPSAAKGPSMLNRQARNIARHAARLAPPRATAASAIPTAQILFSPPASTRRGGRKTRRRRRQTRRV
jgi:hypothetical protein